MFESRQYRLNPYFCRMKFVNSKRPSYLHVLCLCICTLFLHSCKFTPAFAPDSSILKSLEEIRIEEPKNEIEFLFVRSLENRIGFDTSGKKTLKYGIIQTEQTIGHGRKRLIGEIWIELHSKDNRHAPFHKKLRNFVSIPSSRNLVEDISFRRDAQSRLITILSNQTYQMLIAHLAASDPAS